VLRIERGCVAEITSLVFPGLFPAFALPPTLRSMSFSRISVVGDEPPSATKEAE